MIALVAIALVVAASAACRSGDSLEDVEDQHGWAKTIDTILQQAQAAGAGDEQMAILEEAQAAGEVPFEVYSDAVDRALRCIREAGGQAEDRGTSESEGVLKRSYGVGAETEAADPVEFLPGATVHRCIAEHSLWVEFAYQNQPSSVEAKEAFWEQHRDAIVACLRAEGVDVAGDEPMSELQQLSIEKYNAGEIGESCTAVALDEEAGT